MIGKDIGEVAGIGPVDVLVASTLPPGRRMDAIIDFSIPAGTMAVLPPCIDGRIPLRGGHDRTHGRAEKEIEAAAHHTAILMLPT